MENADRYFLQELAEQRRARREQLAKAAQEEQARLSVAGALNIDDANLIARIRALGYDGDTARVFDLLPLLYVAWADGRIQQNERRAILDILKLRNIQVGDEAWIFVEALLEQRPSDEYMKLTLSLLRDVIEHSGRKASTIMEMTTAIARSAGTFFGFGTAINEAEEAALERIAQSLHTGDTSVVQSLLTDP